MLFASQTEILAELQYCSKHTFVAGYKGTCARISNDLTGPRILNKTILPKAGSKRNVTNRAIDDATILVAVSSDYVVELQRPLGFFVLWCIREALADRVR